MSGAELKDGLALVADAITKTYPTRGGELTVLRETSLSLSAGQSAAIMGPSGSGKSTLLNILGTLEPPSSGSVLIDGVDPFALTEKDLARFRNRRIGFIFQEHHLLPQCSVLENVLIPTLPYGRRTGSDERAARLLHRVGLAHRLDHLPAELSGGERQRVAIARALINGPALLLADEPTGNLDRTTAETIADLILEVHGEERAVLITVTHSEKLAGRFAKRWELIDGRLLIP
jgi:lipoprotein-releasing system ATP-binding protein